VDVGIGHSTPVVQGERVFQLSRQGEREVVRALELLTGATLWEHSYDAPYIMNPAADSHGKGPKSTQLVVHPVPTPAGVLVKDESRLVLWRLAPLRT
jgi:hypothetical protein